MVQKQIYIITGGPGFGKTALIDELRRRNYMCAGEFAREIIEEQQMVEGDLLPWKKPEQFQQEVLRLRKEFFESMPFNSIAFTDRAIPDQLAFARYRGFGTPEILKGYALKYRYAQHVFITPPWPAIFVNDTIRNETFEKAILIHQAVIDSYSELNYEMVELPLASVSERLNFIFQTIHKTITHEL